MKTPHRIVALATLFGLGLLSAFAAEKKIIGGPKGGRLLEGTEPRAEFFVEKDHTVTIAFYDANLKPAPVTTQSATVMADAKTGKTRLAFAKKGDVLVSESPLPPGDGYNVVVQLKQSPEAKPQNFRIKFDETICNECKRAEYACICGD